MIDSKEITYHLYLDVLKFILALFIGVGLDLLVYQFNALINPTEETKETHIYIVIIGILQILLNTIVVRIMGKLNFNGTLSTMALFIPQTIVLNKLFNHTYVKSAQIV